MAKESIVESISRTPIQWSADLKWFKVSDGCPDNARPVFVCNKDSFKNPGKIAHYRPEIGWYKVVEGKTVVKIKAPRRWMEIITEPAYRMFEAEVEAAKQNDREVNEKEQKELKMDFGNAFYDMLFLLKKKDIGLPQKTGNDTQDGDSLIMHFKSSSDAKKFADVLVAYKDERASLADPEDIEVEDDVLSKVMSIEAKGSNVVVVLDKRAFESEDICDEDDAEDEDSSSKVVESLMNDLFN